MSPCQVLLILMFCIHCSINLTILDFLHSVEIAFFLFSLFFLFLFVCELVVSVFLLTCNLILFNADVKWLPG